MAQQNWDRIADEEFNSMDADYKANWADLRKRLGR